MVRPLHQLIKLALSFFLLFLIPITVRADDKFYTKHDVEYVYTDLGQSKVTHTVSLTNKQTGYYASQYSITLKGDSPGVVSGNDGAGPLTIKTNQPDSDTTVLNITFNQQVAGKDQTLKFTLNYSGRPAKQNGQVWEISLPKVGETDKLDEYAMHFVVPESFGKAAFISPSPSNHLGNRYSFSKDQLTKVGVVAAFGNFQTFDFNLDYELINNNPKAAQGEIALPADTTYQRLDYEQLTPKPKSIRVDEDGNWIALYAVPARQTLTVAAIGQVHLLAEPTHSLIPPDPTLRQKYLQPTAYWPSSDAQMVSLAKKLKTPQAIYDYVVSTLDYDTNRARPGIARKGGLQALNSPSSSVCTEFTDLFITLARAAGIPAREVQGYAYTTDTDLRPLSLSDNVFHAWPQYWDSLHSQWVSIDPTWGKTTGGVDYFNKLDFNHFAFVIHGLSDSTPSISVKSAQVKFGTYREFPSANTTVSWQPPKILLPGGPNTGEVTLTNPSGQAIYQLPVRFLAKNISLDPTPNQDLVVLPPFSTHKIPVKLTTPFIPQFEPKTLTVYVGNTTSTYNIPESLFLVWEVTLGITIAAIITVLGIVATKAWSLYLQRPKRPSNLRR